MNKQTYSRNGDTIHKVYAHAYEQKRLARQQNDCIGNKKKESSARKIPNNSPKSPKRGISKSQANRKQGPNISQLQFEPLH